MTEGPLGSPYRVSQAPVPAAPRGGPAASIALVALWFLSLFALYELLSTKLSPPSRGPSSAVAAQGCPHAWLGGNGHPLSFRHRNGHGHH